MWSVHLSCAEFIIEMK